MNILVIDNYDSFTYNLVYILRESNYDLDVYRNDKIEASDCLNYDALVLSPGPGIPRDAGNLMAIIRSCAGKIPILGVCLGHQAIAEYLGGKLRKKETVFHGVQSVVKTTSNDIELFANVPKSFEAGRYHSWEVVSEKTEQFQVTAITEDDSIMALQNLDQLLYGIQFHPESILTPEGNKIITNFLSIAKNQK